jgi:hypothetical protein
MATICSKKEQKNELVREKLGYHGTCCDGGSSLLRSNLLLPSQCSMHQHSADITLALYITQNATDSSKN